MTTKSSGFTLIELLVVVAILGIIAAIGITSYTGYVSATKRKSAENIMRQIALGQTEYYSENGIYYSNSTCSSASNASVANSEAIETELLGGSKSIIDASSGTKKATSGYLICVGDHATNYKIYAIEKESDSDNPSKPCDLSLDASGNLVRNKNNC